MVYGDPAYPSTDVTESPFRRGAADLPEERVLLNENMSVGRVCVEWVFGNMVRYFAFLDFTKNQNILQQRVGRYYTVAALLTNCHSCLYGSQTEDIFSSSTPRLEDLFKKCCCSVV